MASTALIIGGMFLGSPYRADHTPVSVQSILCEQADIYDTVTMKGKVEAQHKCRVFPPGTATVGRIYVTQGQPIEKGEPLVTLYVTGDGTELRQAAEEGVQGLEEWLGSAAILPSGTVDTQPTAVTLTAPQTGIVMDIYCQEDELVTPLAPCVTIADLTDLVVRAQVGEEQLAEIAVGQHRWNHSPRLHRDCEGQNPKAAQRIVASLQLHRPGRTRPGVCDGGARWLCPPPVGKNRS